MRRFLIAALACLGFLAAPSYAQVSLNFGMSAFPNRDSCF